MLVGASGGAGAWPAAALEAVADGVGFGEMAAAEGGSGAWDAWMVVTVDIGVSSP